MGYNSTFAISAEPTPDDFEDLLQEASGGYWFDYYNGEYHTDGKWYYSRDHLTQLSEDLPGVRITVERHGEEQPDSEKYELLDGKVTRQWKFGWVEGDGSR